MRAHLPLMLVAVVAVPLVLVGCPGPKPAEEGAGPTVIAEGPSAETAPASEPTAAQATPGEELFKTKCAKCHSLDEATEFRGTQEQWTKLVKRMQSKNPAWISDAEAAQIAEYAAKTYPKG